MREFNVTGVCTPKRHYMVDTRVKLEKIRVLIEKQKYFTINRARQFGKTTTLNLLEKLLSPEYLCIQISFEGAGDTMFSSEAHFCDGFLRLIEEYLLSDHEELVDEWVNTDITSFIALSEHLNNVCQDKKVVLMIDEVDKTSSNKIFLHFIGMLRKKYLSRDKASVNTFHSVILAGVYDIRNIKLKLKNDGYYTEKEE